MANIKERNWARAIWAIKLLSFVPFIKMVGVNGSLAAGKQKSSSDIDFLIIAQSGRIWTARFFSVVILKLFELYRTPLKSKGKICPNTFLTTRSLLLRPVNKTNERTVAISNLTLTPILDRQKTYAKFINNNRWMSKHGNFRFDVDRIRIWLRKNGIGENALSGRFGDWLERLLKHYQLRRVNRDPRTNQKGSEQVATGAKIHFDIVE